MSSSHNELLLDQLEPRAVWSSFDGIRQIPRPSKHEGKIVEHVRRWASEHGFSQKSDPAGNMVVSVPATPGREAAPTVVLQAHLDMVCEKNEGVAHNFFEDPIGVRIEEDWVKAEGTTLGADNGLGAAAAMAVAVDSEVVHGPLEILFTLDEETGLNGASALDGSLVEGRLLLNLDTEEDDAVYIGCAGAGGAIGRIPLEYETSAADAQLFELSVRGLAGGHSGLDIHQQRGNAIKVMVRLLLTLEDRGADVALAGLRGGSTRNAIARECFADLLLPRQKKEEFQTLFETAAEEIARDYAFEPHLEIRLEAAERSEARGPLHKESRDRLLRTLCAAPHGVQAMSAEVPGLVETSHNLAVVETEGGEAQVVSSYRSSSNSALGEAQQSLCSLFQLARAKVEEDSGYPGWSPRPDSPLVRRTISAYGDLFGEPPAVKAVHAGLECGILLQKVPGLDAVSIGPEILGAHSPDERLRISSVQKFYKFLTGLLALLSNHGHAVASTDDRDDDAP